jgi:hypothetical protein
MSEHLDQDGLADVLADEPAPGALEHLEQCPQCATSLTELRASLGPVSTALAALPEPILPEGLAARLDGAIAKERRALSAGTAPNVVPLGAKRRRNLLPMAGGLAAAAVLVVGGALLVSGRGGSDKQAAHSSGVNAKNPTAGIATSNSGRAYAKGGLGLAAQLPSLLKGQAARAAVTAPQPATEKDSATTSAPKALGGPAVVDPLAALRTNAGLAQCLVSLTDPADPGIPLALDYGSYAGTPALVVVLPSPIKDKLYVYFVGAECNAKDSHVLFFDKLTKP